MEASATVWVASIGALASTVAAICAVLAALRSARLKAEADLVLERFKAEDARRRQAFEIATREVEPLVTALVQAWNDIQTVREVISRTLAPALYSEDAALSALRAAVKGLSSSYGQHASLLPDEIGQAWHEAKNKADLVEAMLLERGTGVASKSNATNVEERLRALRAQLRDAQAVLQHSMLELRAKSMDRVLAML